jgi:serine/threonine protein kinase
MRADIGSYQLERVLGEGGMGVVYLAEHRVLRRRVAIKVLAPSHTMTMPAALQRFLDEAQATSAIEDPGIVQIFDFGYTPDGVAYLVMEYLEGERLDQRVARMGPLPVTQAMRVTRQLASSLRAAHARDVLHRDLKPENILLVTDPAVPGGERTKLLDFGICKVMHRDASVTCTGTIVGTPMYMSPEQCRGNRDLDARSDVYALGCVLYFLLTGQPPFIYRSTGELLRRCLAKLPQDRVPSMQALIDELDELLAHTTGELPAEISTSSFLRAAPANTTLTFALVAQQGTAPTRSRANGHGSRWSWGKRAVLLVAAAMALSAPASPPTTYPSDVIPPTVRTPSASRTVAWDAIEPLEITGAPAPAVPMELPRRDRDDDRATEHDEAKADTTELPAEDLPIAPPAPVDAFGEPIAADT